MEARSTTTPARSNHLEDIMQHETGTARIRDITKLRRGDRVEARRDSTCYSGQVKDTAPGLGMLWIREDGGHGRRAVSADDFSIWRIRQPNA
jgi:hypothetical protein